MDTLTKRDRSKLMGKIHAQDNKATELAMVKFLRCHRISGWRRKQPVLGKPDFVFRGARLAVFVDGCYWHGCQHHLRLPKSNSQYWFRKITRNRKRDRIVTRTLRAAGWRVLRIWEHELRPKREARLVAKLRKALALQASAARGSP